LQKFAEVLVNRSRIYTYEIPEKFTDEVAIGAVVEVPLRNKKTKGYVLAKVDRPEFVTKDIVSVVSQTPVFTKDLVQLAKWLSDYYKCFFITALKSILPKETSKVKARAK
jgi:primosomal protein N' (replication factor Y) (superfamily II helicase)